MATRTARGSRTGGSDTLAYRATVGTAGGLSWGAGWPPNGLARDLRPDEARGLTYTSEPLREPISILGVPEVELWLWTSMPVATCVVRLSDVAPDGTSSLVATGALNLTHRRSDTHPTPMPAEGRTAELVRIPLRTSGYRFAVDHRIRLTVLGGYWPVLWPSPFPGTMRVFRGVATPSRLLLPELPDDAPLPAPPAFGPATPAALREVGSSDADEPGWRIEEDVLAGTVSVTIDDGGASIAEDGARVYSAEHLRLTASDADPAHARLAADVVYRWTVDGADIDIRATGIIASDAEAFDVEVELDVKLDGEPFFAREWRERIPRRLV